MKNLLSTLNYLLVWSIFYLEGNVVFGDDLVKSILQSEKHCKSSVLAIVFAMQWISSKHWKTWSILIQCTDRQFSSNHIFCHYRKMKQIKRNLSFTFLCELYLISVRRHFYKCISTLAPTHFLLYSYYWLHFFV